MTYKVGVISQKGGVGKSTLSRALGREAAQSGLAVKIADLDTQQGTSVDWARRRLDAGIMPEVQVQSFSSANRAINDAENYDLFIIDGPARASKGTLEIAQSCDLIIQPTGASLDDLRPAVLVFHDLVKSRIPASKLTFAFSKIGTEAELIDCRDYVEQAGYTYLDGAIPERPAYRQAQNSGYAITETRYKSLNQAAETLIQSLVNRLQND